MTFIFKHPTKGRRVVRYDNFKSLLCAVWERIEAETDCVEDELRSIADDILCVEKGDKKS